MPRIVDSESLEHHIVVLAGSEMLWEATVLYGAPVEALREVRHFAQELTNACNAALGLGTSLDDVKAIVRRKVLEREERFRYEREASSRGVRSGGS